MQGKATLMKHPIHPMLIPYPIAFFGGALISDIVSHFSADASFWPRASVVLILFGIVSALLAAIFGLIDYFSAPMSAEAKKAATAHMLLNLIVIAVFIGAFLVRSGNATATIGYVLTVVGNLVLLVSGGLGGHLSYHYALGVEESAQAGRTYSHSG